MEPILNLSPQQFRAALAELQLDPQREAALIEQYNAVNAPQQGGRNRGMLRNLLDNIIGFDDEVVTPGERLGAGVEAFAGGLLSDPLGTGADIVRGGYETIERAMAPGATPMDVMGAAGMAMSAGGLLSRPAGSVGMGGRVVRDFDVSRRDASNIFGEGSERVRYTDPQSGGTMEVVVRPNGQASVLELEVPEEFRGQGIGQSLQARVLQDFPVMGGQVSSKAAATTAYRLGRRPYGQPDATLEDVFRMIDEDSSVNLISPAAQPTDLSANRSTTAGLLASVASDTPAQRVARLLREGRASEVTDDLMAQADPQEMYRLYVAGETGMDLPMDEASRMARAREMGFDAPVYHGGTSDIRAISQFEGGAEGGQGVLFSSDEARVANTYAPRRAQPMGENVTPLIARSGEYREAGYTRPFPADGSDAEIENWLAGLDRFDRRMSQPGVKSSVFNQQIEAARANNQPGVVFRQVVDDRIDSGMALPSDVFATVDPTSVRSRFARFDPRLSHLANLNAANVDPLTGAAAVTASQQDDPLANLRAYISAAGGILPR